MNDLLLTKRQAAERLNVSVWKTEQLIKLGLLPVVPVGSRDLIRPDDVSAYISQNVRRKNQPDGEVIVISAY